MEFPGFVNREFTVQLPASDELIGTHDFGNIARSLADHHAFADGILWSRRPRSRRQPENVFRSRPRPAESGSRSPRTLPSSTPPSTSTNSSSAIADSSGIIVTVVVVYLALFSFGRVDPSSTPYFLLILVGISVCLALTGLIELGGQVSRIEHQLAEARIDVLTGLANRRALEEELKRRLSRKAHKGIEFCVAILDIDNFKEVNDQYGHLTGDIVLSKGVAEVIRTSNRDNGFGRSLWWR